MVKTANPIPFPYIFPGNQGSSRQLLVHADTDNNLLWSGSLLRDQPAVLSIKLGANVSIPNNTDFLLSSPNLLIDPATTPYSFSVFNISPTGHGENITGVPIRLLVTFSVSFSGSNQGTRAIWLQLSDSSERYGFCQGAGTNAGDTINSACVIWLNTNQYATFWARQTTSTTLQILGGSAVNATRWQSTLIN
jgi:hypothetical protein